MDVDEESHQTVFLEQRLDELNVALSPANKTADEESTPIDVEETALLLPGKSQIEIPDNTQLAPKPESDDSEEIHPFRETPGIQRPPSVSPTCAPGKDFNAMDVDNTPVSVISLSGVGAPATVPYAANSNRVSLPQSTPTSKDSQSE